jgi:hypothetical protein
MRIVEPEAIEEAWQTLHSETVSEQEVDRLVDAFMRQQPALMAYLMSLEEQIPDEEQAGFMFMYGVWVWQAFKISGRPERMVTENQVEAAHKANMTQMMELDATGPAHSWQYAKAMTGSYRQMPILAAAISELMEGELDGQNRTDDIIGLCLLTIKSVIDSLDD